MLMPMVMMTIVEGDLIRNYRVVMAMKWRITLSSASAVISYAASAYLLPRMAGAKDFY